MFIIFLCILDAFTSRLKMIDWVMSSDKYTTLCKWSSDDPKFGITWGMNRTDITERFRIST